MKLLKFPILFLFLVFALVFTNKSFSQEKEVTIKGQVIDANCYLQDGKEALEMSHKDCALMCGKAGVPLGILTSEGDIYYPVVKMGKNPNDKLMDYAQENVEVKGEVLKQGNNNFGIVISSIKKSK